MKNVKVSIIIPAYNAAQYIDRCVQSALSQTLQEIEIIIVDDGSTDQTLKICSKYDDGRIIVIQQENAGPAAARNKGLDIASGEYVGFMDSDDYADPHMFEVLYSLAKKTGADIANGSYFTVKEDEIDVKNVEDAGASGNFILSGEQLQGHIRNVNTNRELWFTWKGIYKNEMIQKHHIRFPVRLKLGEETPFVLECLLCSEKTAKTEQKLYYYVQRQGSLTKTRHKEGYYEKLNELYLAKKAVYQRYDFTGYETDLNRYTMEHTIPMIISNELRSGKKTREQRRIFKEMRNSEMVSEAFANCDLRMIRSRIRYLAMLLKYRQYTLLSLFCN